MNSTAILAALPYHNKKQIIEHNQTTSDIIKGIMAKHDACRNDYLKISYLFAADTPVHTAKNVFTYLKRNSLYKPESEHLQKLMSPAAIVANADKGIDCKSYALFINGVLDAERYRTRKNYDLRYRFAGYNGAALGHVFAVLKYRDKTYFIDPVLDVFNDRSILPTSYKDKPIMSLVSINGITYPAYTDIGKTDYTFPVVNNAQVGSIFFEAKRLALSGQRNEILKKLDPFADAFIYGYIPSGAFAQNPNARDFFSIYKLPQAVLAKRNAIYPQFQALQKATGLREQEFWGALRALYNTRYGMSPEAFLSEKLGFTNPAINDKETVINGLNRVGAFQVQAALSTLSAIKQAAQAIFGDASKAVNFEAITPTPSDWLGWKNPQTGKDATALFESLAATSTGGGSGTGSGSGSGSSSGKSSKLALPLLLGVAALAFTLK